MVECRSDIRTYLLHKCIRVVKVYVIISKPEGRTKQLPSPIRACLSDNKRGEGRPIRGTSINHPNRKQNRDRVQPKVLRESHRLPPKKIMSLRIV